MARRPQNSRIEIHRLRESFFLPPFFGGLNWLIVMYIVAAAKRLGRLVYFDHDDDTVPLSWQEY